MSGANKIIMGIVFIGCMTGLIYDIDHKIILVVLFSTIMYMLINDAFRKF